MSAGVQSSASIIVPQIVRTTPFAHDAFGEVNESGLLIATSALYRANIFISSNPLASGSSAILSISAIDFRGNVQIISTESIGPGDTSQAIGVFYGALNSTISYSIKPASGMILLDKYDYAITIETI